MDNISLTISDKETPIVIFFGGPASGKTLALIRLTRFLYTLGYNAIPINDLLSDEDRIYKYLCSDFLNMVFSNYSPQKWGFIGGGFMFVKLLNPAGQPVCQIFKAPGIHFFDESSNFDFPSYINTIITSPNRKVWVFFVEQGWGNDQDERNLYAKKICSIQGLLSPDDKAVFLFNKVDRQRATGQYDKTGKPLKNCFFNHIKFEYPNIFTRYKNTGLRKLLFGEYNCETICFSAGIFERMNDGREVWSPSSDWYCSELWNAVQKLIR